MVRHLMLLAGALVVGAATPRRIERAAFNDNREAAGSLRASTLTLRLEARLAMWHPDGADAPGAVVPAFAEAGRPASIPGPLVRVPAGTEAAMHVRNSLGDTLLVYGLHARSRDGARGAPPLLLAPGEERSIRFRLDVPGTYHYWGTTTRRAINFRTLEDAQLTGAIVVDAADRPAPPDRIFVIGMWSDTVHRSKVPRKRVLAVINGRSWPTTERLTHAVGDSVRWRVINASADLHPMHLHGFYFRIDSRGDGITDTTYATPARRLAVTESMPGGGTMSLTWVPERAGNWLFHCHAPDHFAPRGSLGLARTEGSHADHAKDGMNGLVLGIHVRAGRADVALAASGAPERHLRLLVRPESGSTDAAPRFGYALHEGGAEPPRGTPRDVGPVLALARGQPVRITVVNQLEEATAVHWHGIELESYFDGVPGFSGAGQRVTPVIAPADSFVVRMTPPRSGTFIYHTHADEKRQQHAGLAGALVVHEPGAPFDPARDFPIVITESLDSTGTGTVTLVNGRRSPPPVVMRIGQAYRFRFVQMSVDNSAIRLELLRDGSIASWYPVAKDGADLPAEDRVSTPARLRFGIGETYDFVFTPDRIGPMHVEVRLGLRWELPSPLLVTIPVAVVP